MNTTTNIYVVHTYNKITENNFHTYRGVYSSKERADAAGQDYCETRGPDTLHYTVTISALDDIINGEPRK